MVYAEPLFGEPVVGDVPALLIDVDVDECTFVVARFELEGLLLEGVAPAAPAPVES